MSFFIEKLDEETNVFGDNIAKVEYWDFSRSNINDESRIEAITTVASICYDNPNVIGKENLYNRLKAEAMGLPSSSFEFVPVLITKDYFEENIVPQAMTFYQELNGFRSFILNIEKYGEWITDENNQTSYLLTNYRALLSDHETLKDLYKYDDITQLYNTEEECSLIKEHIKTFLYKMDISTSKQHNRHRVSLQELSRRYVSGKKTEFEFYISNDMKEFESASSVPVYNETFDIDAGDPEIINASTNLKTSDLNQMMINHYFEALKQKVKPQSARRILPQSMYTTIWSSFLPFQLDNYLALRDDLHAQEEIRWLAQAMKRLLKIK